ncbi:MAG: insulinase family protein [Fimbriimonadaceae bacterium]|nr:insulinase family protein [Fimbriimonadaceae bacterium]QYK58933.1 MAG: insulinase family protein [Fimbriimonadaceae bacterium]
MTVALAACLALVPRADLRVVEFRDPDARFVVVQAWAKAPEGADPAAWRVMARCLSEGTLEFSRESLLSTAGQTGQPLLIEATDELLSVTVVLPPDGLAVGAHLVASILTQPRLNERIINGAVASLKSEPPGAWEAHLDGTPDFSKVRARDVLALGERLGNPAQVVVTTAGPIERGDGSAAFSGRFKPRPSPSQPIRAQQASPRLSRQEVTFVELSGPVLDPADAASPPMALAAFALGVGKDGAMHRALREGRQWSYRQESVFWPTSKGWRPRLVMARRASTETVSPEQMADALRPEIDRWEDGDRLRALAMAEASLQGRLPVNPFHFSASRRMSDSLASRAAWAGYLELTGKGALGTDTFLELLRQVTLEELKAAARDLMGAKATAK